MFLQSYRWKWKKSSPRDYFEVLKKMFPMDVLIILQLSRGVRFCANDFEVRKKGENDNITKKSSRSDVLTLLTLVRTYEKWAVVLSVPSLTKVEVGNFPLLHCPRWLCLIHGQFDISLRRVKRSVIYKYQCFCLFDIQEWSVLS